MINKQAPPSMTDLDEIARSEYADTTTTKPGLLSFIVKSKITSTTVEVVRSRFDGDYGDICRMLLTEPNAVPKLTFAPTLFVIEALKKPDAANAVVRLAKEWIQNGEK